MKEILKMHLNLKVEELAKKHLVDKDNVAILYENYQFYYLITRGTQIEKLILTI